MAKKSNKKTLCRTEDFYFDRKFFSPEETTKL